MAEHDVEKVWQEFWLPIVGKERLPGDEGDPVNLDQIKRELYDYRQWMETWSEVAYEISGGRLSKINYTPDVYLGMLQDHIDEMVDERVAEEVDLKQIEVDDDAWQRGYDQGHEEGRDLGREDGLEEARSRLW